jgi:hypothetical protein
VPHPTDRPQRRSGLFQPGPLEPGPFEHSHALHVVGHREDTDGAERERDPLRAAALRRRNQPLTCDDAAPGDCRRRSGVAGLCESKRAHSEPSCQRAPTVTNDRSPPPWHRTTETDRRQVELYHDEQCAPATRNEPPLYAHLPATPEGAARARPTERKDREFAQVRGGAASVGGVLLELRGWTMSYVEGEVLVRRARRELGSLGDPHKDCGGSVRSARLAGFIGLAIEGVKHTRTI